MWLRARCLLAVVLALTAVWFSSSSASATVTRYEAEALPTGSPCWTTYAAGLTCSTAGVGLVVPITADWTQPTVSFWGYVDSTSRPMTFSIDGGAGVTAGPTWGTPVQEGFYYTTPPLSPGSHTVTITAGSTQTFFNFYEVSSGTATTTTTAAPTTTTTVPPTTTTTVPPTTTTTAFPPAVTLSGWASDGLPTAAALFMLTCGALLGSALVRRR